MLICFAQELEFCLKPLRFPDFADIGFAKIDRCLFGEVVNEIIGVLYKKEPLKMCFVAVVHVCYRMF